MLPLSLVAPALAQFDTVDTAWERPIPSPSNPGLQPVEVEATPDGGALVVGLAREFPLSSVNRPADAVLLKFSENGDLEWSDTVGSPPIPTSSFTAGRYLDAAVDESGNAYAIVSRPNGSLLRAYDATGTLVWERTLLLRTIPGTSGWSEYYATLVGVHPNGDIIVIGTVDQGTYPRVDVRAFDPNGTMRWEWRGDGASQAFSTAQGFARSIAFAPDGSIILPGMGDGPTFQFFGRVFALDSNGALLWSVDDFGLDDFFDGAAFNSQGDLLTLIQRFDGFGIVQISPAGASTTLVYSYSESGFRVRGNAIAVDAFGRISVGGSRRSNSFGAGEATLFRFDATGAFVGSTIPSVQGAAQDGSFEALHVTPRNDVVAFGYSRTGLDEVIMARIAPDGTERWALRRRGLVPQASGPPVVGLGFGVDARGNLFTLAERNAGGVFPNQTLELDLAKHVQNGPTSQTYCGPAVPNSTGAPAEIRALGPRRVAVNNITLRVDQLPPSALTLLLASLDQSSVATVGGGQGTLCLGGEIGRFFGPGQVRVADTGGSASLQIDLAALPQPTGGVPGVAGETWYFQAWYRDANPTSTSNLSNGVEVLLQ